MSEVPPTQSDEGFAGFFVAFIFGIIMGAFGACGAARSMGADTEPPCHYGTSEIMVREKDGKARIICGCPR